MNNFELSQLIGEKLNLEKVKAIRVSFGDEVAGVYFGEYGKKFDDYIQELKDRYGYSGDHKIQHIKCHPDFSKDENSLLHIIKYITQIGFTYNYDPIGFFDWVEVSFSRGGNTCRGLDKDLPSATLDAIVKVLSINENYDTSLLVKCCKNCKNSKPNNVKTDGLDSDFVCPVLGKSLWLWFAPEVPNIDKHGNPFYCSSFTRKD